MLWTPNSLASPRFSRLMSLAAACLHPHSLPPLRISHTKPCYPRAKMRKYMYTKNWYHVTHKGQRKISLGHLDKSRSLEWRGSSLLFKSFLEIVSVCMSVPTLMDWLDGCEVLPGKVSCRSFPSLSQILWKIKKEINRKAEGNCSVFNFTFCFMLKVVFTFFISPSFTASYEQQTSTRGLLLST